MKIKQGENHAHLILVSRHENWLVVAILLVYGAVLTLDSLASTRPYLLLAGISQVLPQLMALRPIIFQL